MQQDTKEIEKYAQKYEREKDENDCSDTEYQLYTPVVKKSINKLRELSPLWEMVQEGIDIKSIQWAGH